MRYDQQSQQPHHSGGAAADDDLVTFAKDNDIFIIHDNAYSELTFDGLRVGSFLAHKGAKDIGAEFNSLSKTYGYAGARLGFCLGNADYIAALKQVKSNTDYGVFLPVQRGGIRALMCDDAVIRATAAEYEQRRDILIRAFADVGWAISRPKPRCSGQTPDARRTTLRQNADAQSGRHCGAGQAGDLAKATCIALAGQGAHRGRRAASALACEPAPLNPLL